MSDAEADEHAEPQLELEPDHEDSSADTTADTTGEYGDEIRVALPRDAFASASPEPGASDTDENDEILAELDAKVPQEKRISYYVQVFEEMIHTVLEHEAFLFNDEERETIARFSQMSYEARYLFVRLFSRKNGWFRVVKLAYCDEIANMQQTVNELCLAPGESLSDLATPAPEERPSAPSRASSSASEGSSTSKRDTSEIIVIDDDDDDEQGDGPSDEIHYPVASTSALPSAPIDPLVDRPVPEIASDTLEYGLSRFAISERVLALRSDVDELLSLLSLDELKLLGKEVRVSNKLTTRAALMDGIKRTANGQGNLRSMFEQGMKRMAERKTQSSNKKGKSKDKGKGRASNGSSDDGGKPLVVRQTELLIHKTLAHLGSCIKLESGPIRLFARLHLLYYRSVSYSEKTLTQAVLARFRIRNYPVYPVKRSVAIFADRQALLDYEDALIMERKMETCMGEALDPSRGRGKQKLSREERERGLKEGFALFEEVYPRWKRLVQEAQEKDLQEGKLVRENGTGKLTEAPDLDDRLTYYRKRFLAGWPLTRVVWKGSQILAKLHRYEEEVEVLRSLLGQSCFRRGKRGEWYDRLALVLMHHFGSGKVRRTISTGPGDAREDDEGDNDEEMDSSDRLTAYKEEALALCREGLAHPWTHLIYHNSLARRIVRLEKALSVPDEDRADFTTQFKIASLRAARKRVMKGERLDEGETGKHSIWSAAKDGKEVSVEELALEGYEKEGWKGFHSENGILTTIFALLFWDVIFLPIEGVFETAYQSGPLDLSTDAFAIVRSEQVQARLKDIEQGRALELLTATDERERDKKTYCVGVRWAYEREDLLEIIQCITPTALVAICRVYAEEWSHRVGGVPDLFLWNYERKVCRFSEVKGPGDVLSETQKVWIDVLLSAGVDVELCSVKEIIEEDEMLLSDDDEDGQKASRKRARKSASASAALPAKKRKESASISASVEPANRKPAETHGGLPEAPVDEKENMQSERAPRKRVKKSSEPAESSGSKPGKASVSAASSKARAKARGSSKTGKKKKVRASVASNEVIVLSD